MFLYLNVAEAEMQHQTNCGFVLGLLTYGFDCICHVLPHFLLL